MNTYSSSSYSSSQDEDALSDTSTEQFTTDERVLVDGMKRAKVAYFGPVHFSTDDDWIGIAFDEPLGKHTGNIGGHQYFKCPSMHGLFVRSHRLARCDSSGHVTARVKSPYRIQTKSKSSRSELEMEDDIFGKAAQSGTGGFYEARAGTLRSPSSSKLSNLFETFDGQAELSYSSK